ncbi:Ig-like domain-containing protein [Vibrio maritimus]|uniref:Ig-like domain-containing protein n=1 Tax=Vibrio maritimus TaxID=990268 RepID=UPI004067D935
MRLNRFLALGFASISLVSFAKTVTITGTIKTVMPKFEVTLPETIYRSVKEYEILGRQTPGSNEGCELTTDLELAKTSTVEQLYCYFEWTNSSATNGTGWSQDLFDLEGRALLAAGEYSHDYTISFFSGSNHEKVIIDTGTLDYTVVEPEPPLVTNVTTITNDRDISGYTPITHDRNERFKNVRVEVEPRPYDQLIQIPVLSDRACTVPEGQTSCNLAGINISISSGATELVGTMPVGFKVSDKYATFSNNKTISFAWDFRPPVIEQYAFNARGQDASVSHPTVLDVDGTPVTVENNEAVVVISSPHSVNQSDFWWLPASLSLDITPDEQHAQDVSYITLNGENISNLFRTSLSYYTDSTLSSHGTPERIGDKYVYRFNVASIKDGIYRGEISASDVFDNGSSIEHENTLIDRLDPEIHLFNIDDKFTNGDPVFFLEHLVLTIQDETSNNNVITSVKLDGQEIEHKGDFTMARAIQDGISLEARTVHELTIAGTDGNGNTVERTFTLNFLPLDFRYSDVENQKFALVQNQGITFKQSTGNRCTMFKSEIEAVTAIREHGQLHCSVEWLETPIGLESAWDTSEPVLIGAFATDGEAYISARIWLHDKFGRKNLVKNDDVTLLVAAPPSPEILFDEKEQFAHNRYAVEPGESKVTRYRVRSASSPITVTLKRDGKVLNSNVVRQSPRYTYHNVAYTVMDTEKAYNRKLWDENTYTVEVRYSLMPNISVENSAYSYAVPSKRIRMRLESGVKELSTADELTLDSAFGLYDTFYRQIRYKASDMGDWDVRVVAENKDRSISPLTEWQSVASDGNTPFTIDWAPESIGQTRYFAQARLKSPNPDYEHIVRSNKSTVQVLKGTAIEGQLKTMRISGPAPLSTMIQYVHASREDKDAAEEVTWYISDDNAQTWQEYPEKGKRFMYRAETEGVWWVQAKVKNRFTGIESSTDRVQVMSYGVPDLEIDGATNVIEGLTEEYTLYDHGSIADLSSLVVQWSTDGGATYADGSASLIHTVEGLGTNKIAARAAYIGFESNPNAWQHVALGVRGQPPRPVRTRILGEKETEVGLPISLAAKVSAPYSRMNAPIVTEWIAPDGTRFNGDDFVFNPTETDLEWADFHDVTLTAWIDGAKEQTYAEYKHRVQVWAYEFPEFTLAYRQRIKVAPSEFEVWLRRPIGSNLHENFKFDWNGQGKVELTRDLGYKARFTAKKPGLYPITVTVEDDRGNYQDFIEYIEVLEPEPMSIELLERFSNKYQRAPLDVTMRPIIRGGHPTDRAADYRWYLNSELIEEETRSTAKIEGLQAGVHDIKFEVVTRYGQEESFTQRVEVVPNTPPLCTINYSMFSKSARIEADCEDVDGRIARYHWTVDGVERRNIGKRITEYRDYGSQAVVTLVAEDDSGDIATDTITVLWPSQ